MCVCVCVASVKKKARPQSIVMSIYQQVLPRHQRLNFFLIFFLNPPPPPALRALFCCAVCAS